MGLLAGWLGGVDGPAIVAGDFNATRDHKQFRDILGRLRRRRDPGRRGLAADVPGQPAADPAAHRDRPRARAGRHRGHRRRPASTSPTPTTPGSVAALTVPPGLGGRRRDAPVMTERQRRPVVARSSPAPAATSAAGWCPSCCRPAGRSGRWPGRRPGCATPRGRATSRSPWPTSPTPTALAAALRRRRRRLLPRPLDRRQARVRGAGPHAPRRTFAAQRRGGRRAAHRLPRRADPGGRGAVAAPAQPRGGRAHPARQRRPDGRAAGGGRHRQRQRQLRDAAPPHRAAAGDGRAAVGRHPHPADRDPRRAALPRRRRRPARRRQPGVRHRRRRRPHVRRHDAALRRRWPGCRGGGC